MFTKSFIITKASKHKGLNRANTIGFTSCIPYRFGFNGQEKDDEISSSTGAHYDFGAREYDSRIGRWWAVDPLAAKYPDINSYCGLGNNPIFFTDNDGRKIKGVTQNKETGEIKYNRAALRRGTDRYIQARMQTESGTKAIMDMIADEEKEYKLSSTNLLIVEKQKDGTYALLDGQGKGDESGGWLGVTSNLTEYSDIDPNKRYKAVYLDDFGDFVGVTVKGKYIKSPINDESTDFYKQYRNAIIESGLYEFESNPENNYKSGEEKIHGVGAHEELHMIDLSNIECVKGTIKRNINVYDYEKPAMEQEIQQRKEFNESEE